MTQNKISNCTAIPLYFDNATTSYPKAPGIIEEVKRVMTHVYATPNRSSYGTARESNKLVDDIRTQVAIFAGCQKPKEVLFTSGATYSLNLAIKGLLKKGDHVITTGYDHNAVLRPLRSLRRQDIKTSIVKCLLTDHSMVAAITKEIRPQTSLIVLPWVSNVTGAIMPVKAIGNYARKNGITVLVDASQSVGYIPVEADTLPIDMIAFGAHKGLLGPFGVGCLILNKPDIILEPLIEGGTGFDTLNTTSPLMFPESYEVGTQNLPGLAALGKSLDYISTPEYRRILERMNCVWTEFVQELSNLPFLEFYGRFDDVAYLPIASFNMHGFTPDHLADILDKHFRIQLRAGLHCAPYAHEMFNTLPLGALRISVGPSFTKEQGQWLRTALEEIYERRAKYAQS